MYSHTPPVPPPKPGSHDVSRISTPGLSQSPAPPPLPEAPSRSSDLYHASNIGLQVTQPEPIPDPGDQWLPRYLEDKSCVASPCICHLNRFFFSYPSFLSANSQLLFN